MTSEGFGATGDRPQYCGRCGSPMQEGDRFCGTCGAAILATPAQADQGIPQAAAAAQGDATRRRTLLLAGVAAVLLVLLAGGVALAFAGLGPGNLFGGSNQGSPSATNNKEGAPPQPAATEEPTSLDPTTSASPSPSTDSESAQLEEFGRQYDEAARHEDWKATYSMLDESSQREFTEQEWTQKQQALRDAQGTPAPLEFVSVQPNEHVSDSPATITLIYEDGTQETMKAMVPMVVEDSSDSGVPKRYLTEQEITDLKQLSSAPPESTAGPEPTTSGLHPEGADQVREAVEQYYYAVDYEEWEYTYFNLDSESKALFPEEEWIEKNQWYADHDDLKLDSMSIHVTIEGSKEAKVTVDRTFTDGTFISRDTYFVWEDGWWRHHLTEEEKQIFMPDLSYEEFVAAQR